MSSFVFTDKKGKVHFITINARKKLYKDEIIADMNKVEKINIKYELPESDWDDYLDKPFNRSDIDGY